MPAKNTPRVKRTVYFSPAQLAQLEAKRKSNGVPTAETIRRAVDSYLNPQPVPGDYDDVEIVRRAIMAGSATGEEFTISDNEFGKNFDGCFQDPISGRWVYVTGLIVESGWPQHAAASINTTTFCVPDLLSSDELAKANEVLRGAVK